MKCNIIIPKIAMRTEINIATPKLISLIPMYKIDKMDTNIDKNPNIN